MSENNVFQAMDYAIFGSVLTISGGIGVFFALKPGGMGTTEEFLVGNRQMSAFPIALSLASSFLSAITVIGSPAEVYTYGSMVLLYIFSALITMVVTCVIYLPLFYRLNILSTYEYIGRRFNNLVRYQVVCCFLVYMFIYLGVVTYTPALALSKVTGLNLWISVLSTGLVCTLYTTIGGIKAVVWTDVFQISVMVVGLLAVLIQGSIHVGGFGQVWNIAQRGGRLNFFDFDLDPRKRHTFWSILIGGTFGWIAIYCCNQAQIQRYLACKSEREAKKAIMLNWFGMCMVSITACLCGLVIYAVYETCDPITSNRINDPNQLAPLLVLDIFSEIPGMSGLFVASAFSGTLSTISSGINAMSAVTVEDFISAKWKPWQYLSNTKKTLISKFLVMLFGFITIGLAGVASLLHGNVMQISRSIDGLFLGPMIGVFTLAALCPRSNSKGTFVGMIVGLALSLWLGIAAQIYPTPDRFTAKLEVSVAGCLQPNVTTLNPVNTTALMTIINSVKPEQGILDNIYALSYAYYTPVGCLSTILVGSIVSMLTGGAKNVDPDHLAPIIHTIHRVVFKKKQIPPLSETGIQLVEGTYRNGNC